ncbi:MAG: PfkB family carbohydrate kinase [Phycisphaeraceae bacterium]
MIQEPRYTFVGLGEALFDLFPGQQRLGGAPLNVAVHAHRLSAPRGGRAALVSRVGQDRLGELLLRELEERGLETQYIQTDPDRPTGRVYVDFAPGGEPRFEIVEGAAWDVLQYDFDLEDLAMTCAGVCFGTLAQRDAQARNTIYRFLDTARRAVRLLDVNLRASYGDQRILDRSCDRASIVKLSESELPEVAGQLGLGAGGDADSLARKLSRRYRLDLLVLTRGERGTMIYAGETAVEGEPAEYPQAEDADPVGAGDAAAAAVLVGRVMRMDPRAIATLANHCGAFVASQPGATPELPDSIVEMVGS